MKKITSAILAIVLILSLVPTVYAAQTVKITFDLNGGSSMDIPQGADDIYKEEGGTFVAVIQQNKTLSRFPTAVRDGYQFERWEDPSGSTVTSSTTFTEDVTLKAMWRKINEGEMPTVSISFDPGDATFISFKNTGNVFLTQGGSYRRSEDYFVAIIDKNGKLPAFPECSKVRSLFVGWEDENGNLVDDSLRFSKDTVLKAVFDRETSDNRKQYKIRVEVGDRSQINISKSTAYSGDSISVDIVSPQGYEGDFNILGDDNTLFLAPVQKRQSASGKWSFTMPAADVTLVPTERLAPIAYEVSVKVEGNGTASLSSTSAYPGEKVYIVTNTASGELLREISAVTTNKKEVKVTVEAADYYSVIVPEGNVEVTVVFTGKQAEPTPDPKPDPTPPDPTPPGPGQTPDPSQPESIPRAPFLDVPASAWFSESVDYVYAKGIMAGTSTTIFSPYRNTTRAMVATMLYRLVGEPKVTYELKFKDVSSDAYYYDALKWATKNGIVSGYSSTQFGPDDIITREQLVAILYRFALAKGLATPNMKYSDTFLKAVDIHRVSSYATEAMNWAITNNIISGTTPDVLTLSPKNNCTRLQIAVVFHRWMSGLSDSARRTLGLT